VFVQLSLPACRADPPGANLRTDEDSDQDSDGESVPAFALTEAERHYSRLLGRQEGIAFLNPQNPTRAEVNLFKSLHLECLTLGGVNLDLRKMRSLWMSKLSPGTGGSVRRGATVNPDSGMIRAVTPDILEKFRDAQKERDHQQRTYEVVREQDVPILQVSTPSLCILYCLLLHCLLVLNAGQSSCLCHCLCDHRFVGSPRPEGRGNISQCAAFRAPTSSTSHRSFRGRAACLRHPHCTNLCRYHLLCKSMRACAV
jgi:hypothetical protein